MGPEQATPSSPGNVWGSPLLWAAVLAAYLYPLFLFPIHNPNERARVYMTVAMVEHETFAIGYRSQRMPHGPFLDSGSVYDRWGYVNDKALVCDDPELKPPNCAGTLYSAKAPGTSFLGYPFYWALATTADLLGRKVGMDGILLYLRLMVVILPTLLMLLLLRRYASASGLDGRLADLVCAGVALGSMVLTYSHMFAGHQVSAYLLFFCFLAAWKSRRSAGWWWPLAAGLAGGMAVCVEYPMALAAVVLFAYQAVNRPRLTTWVWFGLGGLGPALLMGWFHAAAFGNPFTTPYVTLENPQFVKDIAPGIMGLRHPSLTNLYGSFLAPYLGMFFFAPWLALSIPAMAFPFFRAKGAVQQGLRRDGLFSALALAALTLFIACHSLWRSGWTLGPRYIVPFVPFAGISILLWADRLGRRDAPSSCSWRSSSGAPPPPSDCARGRLGAATAVLLVALVGVSIAVTGACSLVTQGFPTTFFNPLTEMALPLLADGFVTWNLGNLVGLDGLDSLWPLLLLVAIPFLGLAWKALAPTRQASRPAGHPLAGPTDDWAGRRLLPFSRRVLLLALAILVGAVAFRGLMLPQKKAGTPKRIEALAWSRDNFFPAGAGNRYMEQRKLRQKAAAKFPRQESVLSLRQFDQVVAADCRGAMQTAEKAGRVGEEAVALRGLGDVVGGLLPLPGALPVPLLLRPDFKFAER